MAVAVPKVPALVVTGFVVLVYIPGAGAVTSTTTVQLVPGGIVALESVNDVPPLVSLSDAVAPQPVTETVGVPVLPLFVSVI